METIILEIIEEIILSKKKRNIVPAHCSKLELMNEISARREIILENLTDTGILHEGPLGSGVYFDFN